MVAKMSSGSSAYSVLSYNQQKVDEQHAKVLFANKMIEPRDKNYNIGVCLRSFEPYLLANHKTEKPILHVSLNPDPKDKLTDEQFTEIAQEYMEKMGYGNQPYMVYKHEDIDRHHLHIVSVRVDENGKKIDHSNDFKKSMDACRELEQKYKLIPADVKKRQDILPLKPVNHQEGNTKQQIANVIRPIAKSYNFQSLKEYKALLSLYNINMEELKGEYRGKVFHGLMYSALDKKGNKVGNPIKSSLIGKSVGNEGLQKQIKKSVVVIKDKKLKESCREKVADVLQSASNRKQFEKELEKKGISVVLRQNDTGRIYGATYIDHQNKAVFNGSVLGKEFSANAINSLFNESNIKSSHTDKYEHTDKNFIEDKGQNFTSDDSQKTDSALGGLFDMESQGVDPQEEAFANKARKKKRRKRRKQ